MLTGVLVVVIVLLLATAALAAASVRVLREYERAVVFLLGRVINAKGPGLVLLVPAVDGVLMYELSRAGSEPSATDTEAGRQRLRERLQTVFEVVIGDARR